MELALNPNTPQDILITLSQDKDKDVRCRVAKNPNTPNEILQELSNDKNNEVRQFALKNMEKLNDPSHQSTQSEQTRFVRTQSEQAEELVRCNPIPFVEWISAKVRG